MQDEIPLTSHKKKQIQKRNMSKIEIEYYAISYPQQEYLIIFIIFFNHQS